MPRRRIPKTRTILADPLYESRLVHRIVNHFMKKGKKLLAYKIIYDAMKEIERVTKQEPLIIIEKAVENVKPAFEIKAKRIGGSTYQIPLSVKKERAIAISIRWLLSSSKNRQGKNMVLKMSKEFIEASKKTGNAFRKREEVQKMADANKAFAKNQ